MPCQPELQLYKKFLFHPVNLYKFPPFTNINKSTISNFDYLRKRSSETVLGFQTTFFLSFSKLISFTCVSTLALLFPRPVNHIFRIVRGFTQFGIVQIIKISNGGGFECSVTAITILLGIEVGLVLKVAYADHFAIPVFEVGVEFFQLFFFGFTTHRFAE